MKKIIWILTGCLWAACLVAHAQKNPLTQQDLDTWLPTEHVVLSPDGKYILYSKWLNGQSKGVIKSVKDNWEYTMENTFMNEQTCAFSSDCRYTFLLQAGGLAYFDLKRKQLHKMDSISNYKLVKIEGIELLIVLSSGKTGYLTISWPNKSAKKMRFENVTSFQISPDKKRLYFLKKEQGGTAIYQLALPNGNAKKLYQANGEINKVTLSNDSQFACFEQDGNSNRILHMNAAGKITSFDSISAEVENGFSISSERLNFGSSGSKLFLILKKSVTIPEKKSELVSVDIWNYLDRYDQELQMRDGFGKPRERFFAFLDMSSGKIHRLQQEDDMDGPEINSKDDTWILFRPQMTFYGDSFWQKKDEYYLINTSTGKRDTIRNAQTNYMRFDPSGKYLYWLSIRDTTSKRGDWWLHEVITGKRRNITAAIPLDSLTFSRQQPSEQNFTFGDIAGWYQKENAVLISDNRDLWKVNITGNERPLNLTKDVGREQHIAFKLLPLKDKPDNSNNYIDSDLPLLLLGQEEQTKNQGLYWLKPHQKPQLQKETYGAYTYQVINRSPSGKYVNPEFDMAPLGMPVKARNANQYIIYRSSVQSPPNVFATTDFRHLVAITHDQPQEKVNWMTSELHRWKDVENKARTGVLFKPEDFNPAHKYPVIFYYYENCSAGLNAFQFPKWSGGSINIPWFVSNGYIVFVPDIDYVMGHPGQSSAATIISAADYLKNFVWVDTTHMGLQGHSYGGYETNFVITKTNKFKAACAAAGPSDLTSLYGSTDWAKDVAENGQNRIGSVPWTRPDLFIENSPIYFADKVKTPLLLIQSKADWKIPFKSQGISFFSALRRLNKPVWMLQYDNEGHSLAGEAAKDFTIRITQYFDHYLKDKPAPVWMTRGVPGYLKGIETGLDYSTNNKTKL